MITLKEKWIVLVTILIFTALTSSNYISQYLNRPKNHVFIGISHHFEDMYYYFDQFEQGAEGKWLIDNRFSTEKTPPVLFYINHVLLGKIGKLLGLPVYLSYNLSVIILRIIFLALAYYTLFKLYPDQIRYRFVAFLFFLLATSFPVVTFENGTIRLYGPSFLFRAENTIYSRFGAIPNIYVINILFLLGIHLLLQVSNKLNRLLLPSLLVILWLTASDAFKTLYLGIVWIFLVVASLPRVELKKYIWVSAAISLIIFLPSIFVARFIYQELSIPVYNSANNWDIDEFFRQYKQLLTIQDIVVAAGSLGILFVAGLIPFIRQKQDKISRIAVIIAVISIVGYALPVIFSVRLPGFRFVFSSTYIFVAAIGTYCFILLEKYFSKAVIWTIVAILLFINLATFKLSFATTIEPVDEPLYHFAYIPFEIFDGFIFLRDNGQKNAAVLANPYSSVDLYIPGLAGKRSYTGHFLMTLDAKRKEAEVIDFFNFRHSESSARQFLKRNNITYVVFTFYDGDKHIFKKNYPYLHPVFENAKITIFVVPD